jgi:hypothetical protein
MVPIGARSFVGLRSMCRRAAALPDRPVVQQGCAQWCGRARNSSKADSNLLQKPDASGVKWLMLLTSEVRKSRGGTRRAT